MPIPRTVPQPHQQTSSLHHSEGAHFAVTQGKNPEPTALPRRDPNRHPDHSQPHRPPSHSQCFPAAFRQELFETRLDPNSDKDDLDKLLVLDHPLLLRSPRRDRDLHHYLHRRKEEPYPHSQHRPQEPESLARRKSTDHCHRFVRKVFLPALPDAKQKDPLGHRH